MFIIDKCVRDVYACLQIHDNDSCVPKPRKPSINTRKHADNETSNNNKSTRNICNETIIRFQITTSIITSLKGLICANHKHTCTSLCIHLSIDDPMLARVFVDLVYS